MEKFEIPILEFYDLYIDTITTSNDNDVQDPNWDEPTKQNEVI